MTTMRFISAIQRAAMLGLVALSCLAPMRSASAQVAISGTYYEEVKAIACGASGISSCQLVFSAVPQNVLITDVSCYFNASQQLEEAGFAVSDSATPPGTIRRIEFFPPQLVSNNNYAAKFKTNFLIGSGHWPTIFFNMLAVGTGSIQCKFVGTLQIP